MMNERAFTYTLLASLSHRRAHLGFLSFLLTKFMPSRRRRLPFIAADYGAIDLKRGRYKATGCRLETV